MYLIALNKLEVTSKSWY